VACPPYVCRSCAKCPRRSDLPGLSSYLSPSAILWVRQTNQNSSIRLFGRPWISLTRRAPFPYCTLSTKGCSQSTALSRQHRRSVRLGRAGFQRASSVHRPRFVPVARFFTNYSLVRPFALNPVHGAIHPLCFRSCAPGKPSAQYLGLFLRRSVARVASCFWSLSSSIGPPGPEREGESEVEFMVRTGWYKPAKRSGSTPAK